VVLCELTHYLRINQSAWIFEFLSHLLEWRVKVIWKYFITLDKDTIQRQQVNKQQRAWSQSGRQHMMIVVNVARFELKLNKQVKRSLAFILSDLIWKKGVVCLYLQIFYLLDLIWKKGVVLLCANILFAWLVLFYLYFAFHQSAVSCVQFFIALCYKIHQIQSELEL